MKNCLAWMLSVGLWAAVTSVGAVQTRVTAHDSEAAFKAGQAEDVLINSYGELSLARETERLAVDSNDVWLVNDLVEGPDGSVYVATAGQGLIYRLTGQPVGSEREVVFVGAERGLNHILSLAVDDEGRLLVGATGDSGELLRQEHGGEFATVFCEEGLNYIWSIAVGASGEIFLGVGAKGRVLQLDRDGTNAQVLFEAKESNILCVTAGADGAVYAGGDELGLVYRIDPSDKTCRVIYDTGHQEVGTLLFDGRGNLYAATSDAAEDVRARKLVLSEGKAGRPVKEDKDDEADEKKKENDGEKQAVYDDEDLTTQQVAQRERRGFGNAWQEKAFEEADRRFESMTVGKPQRREMAAAPMEEVVAPKEDVDEDAEDEEELEEAAREIRVLPLISQKQMAKPGPEGAGKNGKNGRTRRPTAARRGRRGNEVFRIDAAGFARGVFGQDVVILDMAVDAAGQLLLATGNGGDLLSLDIEREEAVVLHRAKPSSQISAVMVAADGRIYAGCANPGAVVLVEQRLAEEGVYTSGAIDAEQVSRWGKLQVAADVPNGATLSAATRSGNTADPEKGGWGEWGDDQEVDADLAVTAGAGRFLQYRLTLRSGDGRTGPLVREVRVASVAGNVAPVVSSLAILGPEDDEERPRDSARGVMKVAWEAADENDDDMTYDLYIRLAGSDPWVRVGKDLEKGEWAWPTPTVADGAYEFKVVATDENANPAGQGLTGARMSRVVRVDNTPPEVSGLSYTAAGLKVTVETVADDALSALGSLSYTVDSAKEWRQVAPVDGVFDSRRETFRFTIELEEAGRHLLALRYRDALGNATYRNMVLEVND